MAKLAILGSGFISDFYAKTLLGKRSRDEIVINYSRTEVKAKRFAETHSIPNWTTSYEEAINHPDVELVINGLPNNMHAEPTLACAKAGKGVLITKPLARNAEEGYKMLQAVEEAGIFAGYLEDLVYTPKTMKSIQSVKNGALGKILWARSREAHPGPHSDWFWDKEQSGGGALLDLGCHCIEIARSFIGKNIRPIEVMCWADTQVKPIEAEDHAIGLVKYQNGAIGQFEVSWSFRGGMDLRDEVMGTEGTIWLNHFLRTGFEMFTAPGNAGYVAEKAESESGWLFPVGDEEVELGYVNMFNEMLKCYEDGTSPTETFYDGYLVNEIMDACLKSAKSKKWEPVELKTWRGRETVEKLSELVDYDDEHYLIKEEKLPDGSIKVILKHKVSGKIIQIEK
ncbi:MAG: Gfo/Idh/MocA family oxidoreductase [Bacteroidetes bacterium]|nr:Gfo/Idh/MocA family oxidoreductase [Bacteroidota bacterium]MDA1119957.1 Gfo/Idh/MocA family oxidoreductase [Bacteroidota bacterium]